MASPVVTVGPDTSVHKAANSLRGHAVGCLIVMNGGAVVGIVTMSDLMKRSAEPARHRLNRQMTGDLNHRVPHRKGQRGGVW